MVRRRPWIGGGPRHLSADDKSALQHEIEKLVARFATSKFVEIEMSMPRDSKAGK